MDLTPHNRPEDLWAGLPVDSAGRPPHPGWVRGAGGAWAPLWTADHGPTQLPPAPAWCARLALWALAASGAAQAAGAAAFALVAGHAVPAGTASSPVADLVVVLLVVGAGLTIFVLVAGAVTGSALRTARPPGWVVPVLALAGVIAVLGAAWALLTVAVGGADPYYGGPL